MFKPLTKSKGNLPKSKKEKHDDFAVPSKSKLHPHPSHPKEKKHKSIKKKHGTHGASSAGSNPSSDDPSHTTSHSALNDHDSHRIKKRQIDKECEEAVNKAVSEFFDAAWLVCAERFFIQVAPQTVSFELRNTWLRVVEAEWQDPDMREKPSNSGKNNKIFKRDQPPLPLAFDTWSRGAIEAMPRQRRESVLDPFLRDLLAPEETPVAETESTEAVSYSMASSMPDEADGAKEFTAKGQEVAEDIMNQISKQGIEEDVPEDEDFVENTIYQEDVSSLGEKWNFDLDRVESPSFMPRSSPTDSIETSYRESDIKFSLDSSGGGTARKSPMVYTVYSAKYAKHSYNIDEDSTTDDNYSSPTSAKPKQPRKSAVVVKRFSASQCGGRTGSGVYRLPNETTSEAVLKRERMKKESDSDIRSMKNEGPRIQAEVTETQEDIVHVVSKKADTSPSENLDIEESEVRPLFEERTPRINTADNLHSAQMIRAWRMPSIWDERIIRDSRVAPMEEVASEISQRFLRRKVVNLRDRFRKQALRTMAERAKKFQAQIQRSSTEMSVESDASVPSSKQSKVTKSRYYETRSRLNSSYSQSASTLNISKKWTASSATRSGVAKGAVSEPAVGTNISRKDAKKQPMHSAASVSSGNKDTANSETTKPESSKATYGNSSKGAVSISTTRSKGTGFVSSSRSNHNARSLSKSRSKNMGNVRAVIRPKDQWNTMSGKYEDARRTSIGMGARFESRSGKFSRGGNKGWAEGNQTTPPSASDCQTTGTCSKNSGTPY